MSTIYGNPESVQTVADGSRQAAGGLSTGAQGAGRVASGLVPGEWTGTAAEAFTGHMTGDKAFVDDLFVAARTIASALDGLASGLRTARSLLQEAQATASGQGFSVDQDGNISDLQSASAAAAGPSAAQAAANRAEIRQQIQGQVDRAREAGNQARAQAKAALGSVQVPNPPPLATAQGSAAAAGPGAGVVTAPVSKSWEQYFLGALAGSIEPPNVDPNSLPGSIERSLWVLGRAGFGIGTAAKWQTRISLGRFAPRDASGRFVSPDDLSWWERMSAARDSKSWVAKPFQAEAFGKMATAGKWAGRAGLVVGGVSAGLSQWIQDSSNHNLDTTARVARATDRGVTVAATAWVGAQAGGEIGMGIGTVICPGVGTVVGGVVGGIVGGAAGAMAGNKVADATVHAVGKAADWTEHEGSKLAKGAVHALESLNPF